MSHGLEDVVSTAYQIRRFIKSGEEVSKTEFQGLVTWSKPTPRQYDIFHPRDPGELKPLFNHY
jgi:hypothetical protein